eukprot:scaffold194581_cov18-Tisochrysis_lutea.AAC.1
MSGAFTTLCCLQCSKHRLEGIAMVSAGFAGPHLHERMAGQVNKCIKAKGQEPGANAKGFQARWLTNQERRIRSSHIASFNLRPQCAIAIEMTAKQAFEGWYSWSSAGALELKLHCAQAVAGIFAGMGLLWQTALGTFDLCFCEQNATRTEPCYCTASCVLLAPMFTAYEQIGPAGGKVDISAKP